MDVIITNNESLTKLLFGKAESLTGDLDVYDNALEELGISGIINLQRLNASGNQLSSVDLSKNTNLTDVVLSNNKLTSIDLSNNKNIEYLYLFGNEFESIDVSSFITSLMSLSLDDNVLARTNLVTKQAVDPVLSQKHLAHYRLRHSLRYQSPEIQSSFRQEIIFVTTD